jgi:hypothetical protein
VLKNPAGTPLGHADGQFFGPCTAGESNCEIRTLPDGTQAAARENSRPPALQLASTLSAQRPDGTYVQVIASVGLGPVPTEPARPVPALTNADLFEFATVFTLPGEPDKASADSEQGGTEVVVGDGSARFDDQLAAAGGLPTRFTLEGAGDGQNPTTFQQAPDGSATPRYFLQVTLVADGMRTQLSIWVQDKESAGSDPGPPGDCDGQENCTERQEGGTALAIWDLGSSDEDATLVSSLRPDGTAVQVRHSGDPGSKLMSEDELTTLATAFTY